MSKIDLPSWTNHTETSQRTLWHGTLKPMLEDDAVWQPTYNMLVAAILAVWITFVLIGLAAWAQFALSPVAPTGNAPAGQTSPHSLGAGAAGATGDRP